jgi:small conductance mechanosensitive channel
MHEWMALWLPLAWSADTETAAAKIPVAEVTRWFENWIPVAVILLVLPVARIALALVRRAWLAGVTKMPVDRLRARQRIETIMAFVRSVVYFGFALLVLMYSLRALFPGFDPATATGALSILALILTGMFRDVVVDVVKGLDILLGRHYGVGDYIRVGNFAGYVTDFQLKYTKLRSAGGEEVVLNNAACIPSRRFPEGWVANYVDVVLANADDETRARAAIDDVGTALARLIEAVKESPLFEGSYRDPTGDTVVLRYAIRVLPGADWAVSDRYIPMIKAALSRLEIPLVYDPKYFFMNDVAQFRALFQKEVPIET